MDSSSCFRVQNTFPQTPESVAGSSKSRPGRTTDAASFQGCHCNGGSCPEQLISTLFPVEKGPGTGEFRLVINQAICTKQISSKRKVQNGEAPYRSLSSTQGRLYDETRPQLRLLCSPDTPGVEEISSF